MILCNTPRVKTLSIWLSKGWEEGEEEEKEEEEDDEEVEDKEEDFG